MLFSFINSTIAHSSEVGGVHRLCGAWISVRAGSVHPVRRGVLMKRLILLLIIGLAMPLGYAEEETGVLAGLKEMSSEDLLNIEVTSVFKKPGKLFAAPAAVTVITSEEIRRSGATTLAELFRMVPGMHVARSDANLSLIHI